MCHRRQRLREPLKVIPLKIIVLYKRANTSRYMLFHMSFSLTYSRDSNSIIFHSFICIVMRNDQWLLSLITGTVKITDYTYIIFLCSSNTFVYIIHSHDNRVTNLRANIFTNMQNALTISVFHLFEHVSNIPSTSVSCPLSLSLSFSLLSDMYRYIQIRMTEFNQFGNIDT